MVILKHIHIHTQREREIEIKEHTVIRYNSMFILPGERILQLELPKGMKDGSSIGHCHSVPV